MILTLSNLIGIGVLILILVGGQIIKRIGDRKVNDLDGFSGCMKTGKKSRKGSIISTL